MPYQSIKRSTALCPINPLKGVQPYALSVQTDAFDYCRLMLTMSLTTTQERKIAP